MKLETVPCQKSLPTEYERVCAKYIESSHWPPDRAQVAALASDPVFESLNFEVVGDRWTVVQGPPLPSHIFPFVCTGICACEKINRNNCIFW